MKKTFHTFLFLTFLLSIFTSCSYFNQIHRLKDMTVKDIFIVYDSTVLRVPGNKFGIGVGVLAKPNDSLKHPNDTLLFTRGFKNGSLYWSSFNVKAFGCRYANGKLELAPKAWPEKGFVAVDVEVKGQTNKRSYISIPKNYLVQTKLFAQNTFNKAPGNTIKLGVIKTYDNNYVEILKKKKDVINYFASCNVLVTGGEYVNGSFLITNDFFDIENNEAGVIAQPQLDATLADTFKVQLDYIDNYEATFFASNKFSAPTGVNGNDGASASCYGCNGRDGEDATRGYDGLEGEHGHDIAIDMDVVYDSILRTDLCIFAVEDLFSGERSFYKVNPKGGHLAVTTHGGNGAAGGEGGYGGNGGNGGIGESYLVEKKRNITVTDSTGTHTVEIIEQERVTKPGGNGGYGGNGGDGGYGGPGGVGGNIDVYYTQASYPYLHCLQAISEGGSGGFFGTGGYAGQGGKGGEGNPSGRNGSSGRRGSNGVSGPSGRNGIVSFQLKNEQ